VKKHDFVQTLNTVEGEKRIMVSVKSNNDSTEDKSTQNDRLDRLESILSVLVDQTGEGPTLSTLSQFNLNKTGPVSLVDKKKGKTCQVTKNDQNDNLCSMLTKKCLTIAPTIKKIAQNDIK
jgi:hypothetical protein